LSRYARTLRSIERARRKYCRIQNAASIRAGPRLAPSDTSAAASCACQQQKLPGFPETGLVARLPGSFALRLAEPGHPLADMRVAQPAGAFLDVGLQVEERLAKPGMA
jgi:hypothetical protein